MCVSESPWYHTFVHRAVTNSLALRLIETVEDNGPSDKFPVQYFDGIALGMNVDRFGLLLHIAMSDREKFISW